MRQRIQQQQGNNTEMTWLEVLRTIKEEGAQAKRDGKSEHENPYSFTTETAQAYAWEDGYKSAR